MSLKSLKNSYWFKSGFYTIGYRLSVLVFGFGSFYFLIRHLTQYSFGAWALFLTITTIVEMSRNGLIQNGLIKLLASHDATEANRIITASWFLNLFYSAIVYLLLVGFSIPLSNVFAIPEISEMFLYYGITVLILVPFSQFNYLQQSKLSFSGIFWSTILRQGTFFFTVLVIYLVNLEVGLVELVLIQSVCTCLGLICAFLSARKFLQTRFEWHGPSVVKVFQFGKYVMGTNVCSILYKSIDQLSVGYFFNANLVALYNSAARMSNLIEYPSTAIAEVVYPQSAFRTSREGDHVAKTLYEKSVGFTLALTIPVVLITLVLADYIIYFIAGPAYAAAANILRITILFGVFTSFTRQFGTVMDSSGRPKINFQFLLFSLLLNIVSNYFFIRYFGFPGAAYGTLFSHAVGFVLAQYVLAKTFNVELLKVFGYTFFYYGSILSFMRKTLKLKLGVG
jgi:lipopolysaccharide exporter